MGIIPNGRCYEHIRVGTRYSGEPVEPTPEGLLITIVVSDSMEEGMTKGKGRRELLLVYG